MMLEKKVAFGLLCTLYMHLTHSVALTKLLFVYQFGNLHEIARLKHSAAVSLESKLLS